MKILHTADIHLKKYEDERWNTLQKLIEIGKEENVEIFVISGDLFDKEIDAESLRSPIRQLFSNNSFKIVILPGNHDSNSYKGGMYFGDDANILTEFNQPFEYKDLKVWGLPFEPIKGDKILDKLYSLSSSFDTKMKNILLYHGELVDAFDSAYSRKDFGDEGEERYMPLKLSYLKDLNIKYVLAGHFHSKFEMWEFDTHKYFVYPGSPVSITKKEIGQRKVNLFELGSPPKEYSLDTFHYEELNIEFDPFEEINLLSKVNDEIKKLPSNSRIKLNIRGYINSEKIKINEDELVKKIKDIIKEKCDLEDFNPEFKNISEIIEDDLFKNFKKKLDQNDYNEEKKKQLIDLAIKAMMVAKK
jgi:DNA repair exonuclease SbcCD nuclease subunit